MQAVTERTDKFFYKLGIMLENLGKSCKGMLKPDLEGVCKRQARKSYQSISE